MWRMFRVLITIIILCVAFSAFQNVTNVDYYGDCNVSMLSLWIILIYLSALRVAYNLLMLLLAGLFSCCCCCCQRADFDKDKIKETKGAGFGEDKDLGQKFMGTSYFATLSRESVDRLDDNVFGSKPSEMRKRRSRDSCPPPSPPSRNRRRSSRRSSGTARIDIDSNMIASTPSEFGSSPSDIRPPTGMIHVPPDVRPPIVELASMNMSFDIDISSSDMIPSTPSELGVRNVELGPMRSLDPTELSMLDSESEEKKKKKDISSI